MKVRSDAVTSRRSDAQPAIKSVGLTQVLLRLTLLAALLLGVFFGVIQLLYDISQEKLNVEHSVNQHLDSVEPALAGAVYDFDDGSAEQAVTGIFTQAAILKVEIYHDAEASFQPNFLMLSRERDVEPTLPVFVPTAGPDIVVLTRELRSPRIGKEHEIIGSIVVSIDRSVVPQTVVNRIFLYFALACLKNFIFGMMLVAFVYAVLARHVIALAERVSSWVPGDQPIAPPPTPKIFSRTELETLGERIVTLSRAANRAIVGLTNERDRVVASKSALEEHSHTLSTIVDERTRELEQANEQLRRLAERDVLTGLYNRRYFDASCAALCDQAERAGIGFILIDVDYFKMYNDHYGHQSGDDCLKKVADCISKAAEKHGAIAARYGGEEFVVLVESNQTDVTTELAEDIHGTVLAAQLQHALSDVADIVTVSLGTARALPGERFNIEAMLVAADRALYDSKRSGRNRVTHSNAGLQRLFEQRKAEDERLQKAVHNEEFEPYFQPQFDGRTGEITGAEALARWPLENGRIGSPASFIDHAQTLGLIRSLDTTILKKSLVWLSRWQELGIAPAKIAVNASIDQLRELSQADLQRLDHLKQTTLALEILESTFIDAQHAFLMERLSEFRAIGVDIEIDDFGTGHTSIVGLMRLRPDRLKIALEIVSQINTKPAHRQIVASIIDIARSLNIDVVAEGVENGEQADTLMELGCFIHQGYYYAAPVPAEEFESLLMEAMRPENDVERV